MTVSFLIDFFGFFDNSVRTFLTTSFKWVFEILKGAISLTVFFYIIESLSCFNPYFLIFSSFLNVPKKAKSKSINLAKKWYIKADSKILIC